MVVVLLGVLALSLSDIVPAEHMTKMERVLVDFNLDSLALCLGPTSGQEQVFGIWQNK